MEVSVASLSRWSTGVPQTTRLVITTTAVATAALLFLARLALWPQRGKLLPNPLKTVAAAARAGDKKMKKGGELSSSLVYHPDVLPGARDVETPYGAIRVYEFGPEDGDKVLLIHGISTPCVILSGLAHRLAERGFRVMLFDLFGRGFSDGVGDLPHDARLYVSQILLVLASSPLSWTGTSAMRLIGYSLGGGIAVHFATAFPHLVSSLALLAPAGLIRIENFGIMSRLLFRSGLVPERILAYLTEVRLRQPIAAAASKKPKAAAAAAAAVATATASLPAAIDDRLLPSEDRIMAYVRWMAAHHAGFVPAFMSSIRHAPLTDQHHSWSLLSKRRPGTTLVLLAEEDEIIDVDDFKQDIAQLVGEQGPVEWRAIAGAHNFVITHTDGIITELDQWWTTSDK